MKYAFYIVVFFVLLFSSCQNTPDNPEARLQFSCDTLVFDTIFTGEGSSTRQVMLYNHSLRPITITRVEIDEDAPFHINLDGESDIAYMKNIRLAAGDSLYLFVSAYVKEGNVHAPVLVESDIRFVLASGEEDKLHLEAYGQDVERIDSLILYSDYTLRKGKPYLIRHYIASAEGTTLTIEPGVTLYMHNHALLQVEGRLVARGTEEEPIRFLPDRLDHYYQDMPYWYVPGSWSGIYLLANHTPATGDITWALEYVTILSPENAVYTYSKDPNTRATLEMKDCQLHNMGQYGLVVQNTDAKVTGCTITNAVSHCVYLHGGENVLEDNIIASYYKHTYYNHSGFLYSAPKEDVAAVYVHNLSKTRPTYVELKHNIITGTRKQELTIASPLPDLYGGRIEGNYLRCDSLKLRNARDNRYAQAEDTVFRNTYFDEQGYYDFRLDSTFAASWVKQQ